MGGAGREGKGQRERGQKGGAAKTYAEAAAAAAAASSSAETDIGGDGWEQAGAWVCP